MIKELRDKAFVLLEENNMDIERFCRENGFDRGTIRRMLTTGKSTIRTVSDFFEVFGYEITVKKIDD